jgi:hypothetical protein
MTRIRGRRSATGQTWKPRRLLSGLSCVAGLIGASALAFPQTAFAGEPDSGPTITVMVRNYAQVSRATLAAAEGEAGRILAEAGLRTVWIECPGGSSSTIVFQVLCEKRVEAHDIMLRVLRAPIHDGFQDAVFGFTVHPVLATVYYEYAVRRARNDNADFEVPAILGCVMAHEIGHLLLGPNGHSGAGIMQPRWGSKQVRMLLMRGLSFTPEQSKLMRAEARNRMTLRTAALQRGVPGTDDPGPGPDLIPQSDGSRSRIATWTASLP